MADNLIVELFELLIKDSKKKKILNAIMESKEESKALDKILEEKIVR
jgi:hypothetical protein